MVKQDLTYMDAETLHRQGRLDEAKNTYEIIISKNPSDASSWHGLGLLYAEQGDLQNAQKHFAQALQLEAENPIFNLHLANVLKERQLFEESKQLLEGLLQRQPQFAAAFNSLGTLYYAQEKFSEAVEAFQSAIQIQSNYVDAYYNLGLAFHKLSERTKAINTYLAVLELHPTHPGALFQLGRIMMEMEKLTEAINYFSELEKMYPNHFETQTNLATCYLKSVKFLEAKAHYLKASVLVPTDVQVLFNLGVLSAQLGQFDEAIEFYLQVIRESPAHFDAHNNLAYLFIVREDKQKALLHLNAALRLRPNDVAIKHTIDILQQRTNIAGSPPEYIRSLFDSYAGHFDAHLLKTLHYQLPQLIRSGLESAVQLSDKRWEILDLGCGTGLCAEQLKPFAAKLIGVDLSEKMLAVAAQKHLYDHLYVAELLDFLNTHAEQFDLIVAGDVFVYFGSLKAAFDAVIKRLKPEGIFVFNLESGDDLDYQLTTTGRFKHSRRYIQQLLTESGLRLIALTDITMRTQNAEAVKGDLYILQNRGVLPSAAV